jgi:GNAT superfamily N-acetyltransferase
MSTELEPMQLHMFVEGEALQDVEVVQPDGGYELRRYQPGDEEGICRALNAAGFEWALERVQEYLIGPERSGGTHVVAADPAHKGHRLGLAVCSGVVRYLADRGYPRAMLTTDDWRLPAIVTYLRVGFRPNYCREDMPGRWRAVCANIGWPWDEVKPVEVETA